MTYQSFLEHPLRSLTHDRSFKNDAPQHTPLPPMLPAPDPAALDWLSGIRASMVFDGLGGPWWRLFPAALGALLTTWRHRIRARRELAQVDLRSLREAGIDPGFASFEAAQPFWRPQIRLRHLNDDC